MATQQACETPAAPVAAAERLDSLDALRGLALLGVLAINLETGFRVSFFQQFLVRPPDPRLDGWINRFLQVFVDLKALAIFSLLFGIGLAIQHERLAGNSRRLILLLRRLLALLAFGLIHLFLILNGDICDHYANSRFEADPKHRDFKVEVESVRFFLHGLRKRFPNAQIVYKHGNHEERYEKYLRAKAPELLGLED